jgi:hypothetical protein
MGTTMRKGAVLAGIGVTIGYVARPGTHARHVVRQTGERLLRHGRYAEGQLRGLRYRVFGGRPDPQASGNVLADRVRSTLGPLEAQLDLPHVHVMAEDHVILLHGDVATADQAEQIEEAVLAVSGVQDVRSHLHVGLLPSDTRPSEGGGRL